MSLEAPTHVEPSRNTSGSVVTRGFKIYVGDDRGGPEELIFEANDYVMSAEITGFNGAIASIDTQTLDRIKIVLKHRAPSDPPNLFVEEAEKRRLLGEQGPDARLSSEPVGDVPEGVESPLGRAAVTAQKAQRKNRPESPSRPETPVSTPSTSTSTETPKGTGQAQKIEPSVPVPPKSPTL